MAEAEYNCVKKRILLVKVSNVRNREKGCFALLRHFFSSVNLGFKGLQSTFLRKCLDIVAL